VANGEASRDPLTTKTDFRRTVEDELDTDRGRDRRPEPTDKRGLRRGTGSAGERVEQVRSIEDQPVGAAERVAGWTHAANRTRR
jgi:hypothetical protein